MFDIPPKQALRSASISVGSSSAVLPLTPSAWPTYFLIFPCFLVRVMLARCFFPLQCEWIQAKYDCIAYALSLSPYDSHKHLHTLYLDELGSISSVSQLINHQTNWHICHRREKSHTTLHVKISAMMETRQDTFDPSNWSSNFTEYNPPYGL